MLDIREFGLDDMHRLEKNLSPFLILCADTGMLDFRRKYGKPWVNFHWTPLAFTVVSVQVQQDIGAPTSACVMLPIYFLLTKSISWTLKAIIGATLHLSCKWINTDRPESER